MSLNTCKEGNTTAALLDNSRVEGFIFYRETVVARR